MHWLFVWKVPVSLFLISSFIFSLSMWRPLFLLLLCLFSSPHFSFFLLLFPPLLLLLFPLLSFFSRVLWMGPLWYHTSSQTIGHLLLCSPLSFSHSYCSAAVFSPQEEAPMVLGFNSSLLFTFRHEAGKLAVSAFWLAHSLHSDWLVLCSLIQAFSIAFSRVVSAIHINVSLMWACIAFVAFSHFSACQYIAFTPDSFYLATSSLDCTCKLWSTETGLQVCI